MWDNTDWETEKSIPWLILSLTIINKDYKFIRKGSYFIHKSSNQEVCSATDNNTGFCLYNLTEFIFTDRVTIFFHQKKVEYLL